MRVLNPTTVVCPRCGATVSTEYKYCPECAFRLRAGLEGDAEVRLPPSSLWPHVLLLLGALALIGGFVLAGISIFAGPDVGRDRPLEPAPDRFPIITVTDLADQLAVVDEDVADWQPDVDASGRPLVNEFGEIVQLPVITARMYVSKYEISCGQWAEFLEDLEHTAGSDGDPLAAFDQPVRRLFTPFAPQRDATGALVDALDAPGDWTRSVEVTLAAMNDELDAAMWAQGYADIWWRAVTEHFRARGEAIPDRPADLALPLGPAQRRLMLVPPHWIRVADNGSLTWSRPEHPNRPVTEIAFTDTLIFAAWVSQKLDIAFHVPTKSEFMRAYHGGNIWDPTTDTGNRWPWGSQEQTYWVNHLGYWPDGDAALLDVDFDMRPFPGGGKALSADGLAHMAGNAREWTQPQELIRHEFQVPPTDDESVRFFYWARNRLRFRAPVMGGSYLMGLGECDVDAVRYDDIRERAMDIGFRLAAAKTL